MQAELSPFAAAPAVSKDLTPFNVIFLNLFLQPALRRRPQVSRRCLGEKARREAVVARSRRGGSPTRGVQDLRGRAFASFADLRGAAIGIGPEQSGSAHLMRQLFEDPDLRGFEVRLSNHPLERQAGMVAQGELDRALAAAAHRQEERDLDRAGADLAPLIRGLRHARAPTKSPKPPPMQPPRPAPPAPP